jgi:hypothetical protein
LLNQKISNIDSPANEYLKKFEKEIQTDITLESLTQHFTTNNNYQSEKPYLYRRKIKSGDERFESFEIVYDESEKVLAVVFVLKIKLSELQTLFGKSLMHNEPYNESTAFAFKSSNPDIGIIKTRHSKSLTKTKESEYEYSENNNSHKFVDPEFSFVQFDLRQ